MAMTKDQVIRIRDNANALLRKIANDEKSEYKKVALKYEELGGRINSVLDQLKGDSTAEKVMVALKAMKLDLGQAIKISQPDLTPLLSGFIRLETVLKSLPKTDNSNLVDLLKDIKLAIRPIKAEKQVDRTDEVIKAIKGIKLETATVDFPDEMPVHVMSMPPQKIPQPVTNISINPLRGFVHTTVQTVTTALAKIPSYGELDNRRSLQFYNNGSVTVFVGGSDVTASNGLPVPGSSYSPAFDAGPRMILYGVTSSGSAEIRVMELSNDNSGG